jgi:hypothetical protein
MIHGYPLQNRYLQWSIKIKMLRNYGISVYTLALPSVAEHRTQPFA